MFTYYQRIPGSRGDRLETAPVEDELDIFGEAPEEVRGSRIGCSARKPGGLPAEGVVKAQEIGCNRLEHRAAECAFQLPVPRMQAVDYAFPMR
jgi:hypothetical protein